MKTRLVDGDGGHGLQIVVLLSEAEAEIEKARKEGRDEVLEHRLAEQWPTVQKRLEECARADERERIVRELQTVLNSVPANLENISGMRCAMEIIKPRPDPGEQCGYTCEAHKPKEPAGLEEALEWYALPGTYAILTKEWPDARSMPAYADGGARARAALSKNKEAV